MAESDLPILFEHQREPEANDMAAFAARDWNAFIAHWTRILADETISKKTILFDGRVAGNIVSYVNDAGEREVGYWIGREYWGRGLATRALSRFLDQVRTRPLYARVATHNLASIRVLKKCGFTISGRDEGSPDARGAQVEELVLTLGT